MVTSKGYWESDTAVGHYDDPGLFVAIKKVLSGMTFIADLGCGTGYYARELIDAGFSVDAFDGNPNTPELSKGIGKVIDLSSRVDLGRKYDCVISLEVGEHIPEPYEQAFLDNLCEHSTGMIILSWAILGQPGIGHVNCKDNLYIQDQLSMRGFKYDEMKSKTLRRAAFLSWFKNTLMVFKK